MIYKDITNDFRRRELYRRYMKELNPMLDKPATDLEIEQALSTQLNDEDIEWIDIYFATKIVGFIIIGRNNMCHPHADRFIINTYVMPEYRRKHLASSAFRQYIESHHGVYYLEILDGNTNASIFWVNTFRKLNYESIVLPNIVHEMDKNAHGHAWCRKVW